MLAPINLEFNMRENGFLWRITHGHILAAQSHSLFDFWRRQPDAHGANGMGNFDLLKFIDLLYLGLSLRCQRSLVPEAVHELLEMLALALNLFIETFGLF